MLTGVFREDWRVSATDFCVLVFNAGSLAFGVF